MTDKLIDELRTQYNEMTEEPKITGAGYWAEHPKTGIISPEPNTITMVAGNRTLLTFHPDGRVDGDIADASEAARVFCETVSHLFGKTTPSQPATDKPEAVAWLYTHHGSMVTVSAVRYEAAVTKALGYTETALYPEPPSQPDASALVEVLKAIRELCPEVTGDTSSASLAGLLFNIETRCDAALTAWEAQHG